jgi:hypothetical protein
MSFDERYSLTMQIEDRLTVPWFGIEEEETLTRCISCGFVIDSALEGPVCLDCENNLES